MSGKYAFTKSLREVRFLFCQTSEHSSATRYVLRLVIPHEGISYYEEEQPFDTNYVTGCGWDRAEGFARYDFGKEKQESLAGLTDKEIEDKVTGLVKTGIDGS